MKEDAKLYIIIETFKEDRAALVFCFSSQYYPKGSFWHWNYRDIEKDELL